MDSNKKKQEIFEKVLLENISGGGEHDTCTLPDGSDLCKIFIDPPMPQLPKPGN